MDKSYYRLSVDRLSKDELEYELSIRGVVGSGTVEEMRKDLRQIMKLEKEGKPLQYPPYSRDVRIEFAIVQKKLDEAKILIQDFAGDKQSSEFIKIQTKLHHLLNRVNRIESGDAKVLQERGNSIVLILRALSSLNKKAEPENDSDESSAEEQIGVSVIDANSDRGNVVNIAHSTPLHRINNLSRVGVDHGVKSVPVLKWGIHFSGESRDLSVNAFLERVEELRVARNVSEAQLFLSALDLFTGKALNWYRSIKRSVDSWSALKVKLREQFLPYDYEDRLWEEIRRRTQGPDESLGIYVAVMDNMFSRLTIPPNREERLRVVLKNLAPFYQERLSLVDVTSEEKLLELGRQIEKSKRFVEAYKPPHRSKADVEPDLAYVEVASASTSLSYEAQESLSRRERVDVNTASTSNTKLNNCWNCGRNGHRAQDCRAPFRKHCYKCGNPGFTKNDCPKCSSGNGETRPC